MNEQKIRSEWKKFEKGFGAYMFDVRKMGETIKWTRDAPDMMKSLLQKGIADSKGDLDMCIVSIEAILEEL